MIKRYEPSIQWNQYYDGRDGKLIGCDRHLNTYIWIRATNHVIVTTNRGNKGEGDSASEALYNARKQR